MDLAAVRANRTARLLAGRPMPLVGRLLADVTRAGELVPLDPETGGELKESVDERPAFVLSTESEATDGHIVRQHWNLSRANGAGIPVLWNHNQDVLLGQWQELAVQSIDVGPALIGRALFDPEDANAQNRRRQIRGGFLNAVSVGWVPGARVRRGELDPSDTAHRAPEDDGCGMPMEGFVMGTEAEPNTLVEASIVPCPAQAEAVVIERLHRHGAEDLARAVGALPGTDPDRLLAFLASNPRVRAWTEAQLVRIVGARFSRMEAELVELRARLAQPSRSSGVLIDVDLDALRAELASRTPSAPPAAPEADALTVLLFPES